MSRTGAFKLLKRKFSLYLILFFKVDWLNLSALGTFVMLKGLDREPEKKKDKMWPLSPTQANKNMFALHFKLDLFNATACSIQIEALKCYFIDQYA